MIHGSDSSHLRAAGAGDPRNRSYGESQNYRSPQPENRKNCTETMTEKCA